MAGYPEAHPDAIVSDPEEMDKAYWNDLHYLKEKVTYLSDCFEVRVAALALRCLRLLIGDLWLTQTLTQCACKLS